MFNKSSGQPSPVYVFFVLSLAAFLTLFTLWRRPRTQYVARVTIPISGPVSDDHASLDTRQAFANELRRKLLSPELVLASLQNAGMIQGDARDEMLGIAGKIASRMRAETVSDQKQIYMLLSLYTEHPGVGTTLLDQMLEDVQSHADGAYSVGVASNAIASRFRGASISASSLILLILCSALVGIGGLMLLEQSKETAVLLTEEDVVATVRLPVIADFARDLELPARTKRIAWRRRFGVAIRFAEFAIAAAILLMVYNVAMHQTFSDLLVRDPLAAYSEAVGRILG